MRSVFFFVLIFSMFSISELTAQDVEKVDVIIKCENDGQFVNYYLLVRNFIDIDAVQGTLKWNPDSLIFVEFENLGIPSFGSGNLNLNNTSQGQLVFVWFNFGSTGASIEENGVMFRLRFEIGEGIGQLKLTDDPVEILFLDTEDESIEVEVYGDPCITSSLNLYFPEYDHLKVFPNPLKSGSMVYFEKDIESGDKDQISLYSIDGRPFTGEIERFSNGLRIPFGLSPGFYYIKLVSSDRQVGVSKIQVY